MTKKEWDYINNRKNNKNKNKMNSEKKTLILYIIFKFNIISHSPSYIFKRLINPQ